MKKIQVPIEQTDLHNLKNSLKGVNEMLEEHEKNKGFYKLVLATIVFTALMVLLIIFFMSPSISQEERKIVYRFPRSPSELAEILKVLETYRDNNFGITLTIWAYLYIM